MEHRTDCVWYNEIEILEDGEIQVMKGCFREDADGVCDDSCYEKESN